MLKKILILIILIIAAIALLQSCETEEEARERLTEFLYFDDDYILLDRKEDNNIRTWRVLRIVSDSDSLCIGKIESNIKDNDQWDSPDFYITNEFWYNRYVGDTLHFTHLRKSRFTILSKDAAIAYLDDFGIELPENKLTYTSDYVPSYSRSSVDGTLTTSNNTPASIELRYYELDRLISEKKRELEKLEKEYYALKEMIY